VLTSDLSVQRVLVSSDKLTLAPVSIPAADRSSADAPAADLGSGNFVQEGASISFEITRPDDSEAETVYVSTTRNQGSQNENDYFFWLNVPVTFAVGELTKSITVVTKTDALAENPETFGLIVQSNPSDPVDTYLQATTFTIIDDDAPGGGTATSGDDVVGFVAQAGTQTYDGGDGRDRAFVDFSATTAQVTYAAGATTRTIASTAGTVQLTNVEDLTISGSSAADNLYILSGGDFAVFGNDGNDIISAYVGDDTLLGGNGDDTLSGGGGSDVLDGGAGNDRLTVGSAAAGGAAVVTGGDGVDKLDLYRPDLTFGIDITLDETGSFTLADGTTVSDIEILDINTGSGDDHVTFVPVAYGPGTEYAFKSGTGTDRMTVDFSAYVDSVQSSSSAGHVFFNAPGVSVRAVFVEAYTIIGGGGDDGLFTYSGSDVMAGNGGNDLVYSEDGDDSLFGGDGNDTLQGGLGADFVAGDDGDDLIYIRELSAETVDGGAGTDQLYIDIRDLTSGVSLTWSGSDVALTGGTTSIEIEKLYLHLGSGDDTIALDGVSSAGHTIFAGSGQDTLIWDGITDVTNVYGEGGTDTLVFTSGPAPTSFSFGAHGFERAEGRYTDTGGAWWTSITDIYNASWQRTNSDTLADDGRFIQSTFDVSAGGVGVNWQYITD
jgi:Ca2+-binding RTX toxin-like protein